MEKIRGVIFDLDGTLANTLRPLSDAYIIATFGPSEEGTIMTLVPAGKGVRIAMETGKGRHSTELSLKKSG